MERINARSHENIAVGHQPESSKSASVTSDMKLGDRTCVDTMTSQGVCPGTPRTEASQNRDAEHARANRRGDEKKQGHTHTHTLFCELCIASGLRSPPPSSVTHGWPRSGTILRPSAVRAREAQRPRALCRSPPTRGQASRGEAAPPPAGKGSALCGRPCPCPLHSARIAPAAAQRPPQDSATARGGAPLAPPPAAPQGRAPRGRTRSGASTSATRSPNCDGRAGLWPSCACTHLL